MKANHKETQTASAHYQKPATKCISVLSPFLRHFTMGTLAFAMLVALAILSPIRGKDVETIESAPTNAITSVVIVKGGQRRIRDLDFTEKETLRRHLADK
jgi:hypothetical protein